MEQLFENEEKCHCLRGEKRQMLYATHARRSCVFL